MNQNENNIITVRAGEDLEIFRRVNIDTNGEAVYSDNATYDGVTQTKVADGEMVAVALKTSGRTFDVIASGAVTLGATIYGAADGTVGVTENGSAIGKALDATTETLGRIEALLNA
jgi:hypothetical protein